MHIENGRVRKFQISNLQSDRFRGRAVTFGWADERGFGY